jgi:type II secretory pathway component PulF
MLLRLQPRADERAALAFEDLASGIDAGLSLAMLGIDAAANERVLPDLFARRRIVLDPSEDLVLVAAWRAGRAPVSLRLLAEQRRSRAQLARTIGGGLVYPILLCTVALLVSFVLRSLPGMRWLPWTVLVLLGVGAGLGFALLRALGRGAAVLREAPLVGPWLLGMGEIPYLEALCGLYGAGVPLLAAHPQAVATSPVADVRARLQRADAYLQEGRPLGEALAAADALHAETRDLLANGERAGGLEDALLRSLRRRRDVVHRNAAALGRMLAWSLYVFGAGIAVFVIFSNYRALGSLHPHR